MSHELDPVALCPTVQHVQGLMSNFFDNTDTGCKDLVQFLDDFQEKPSLLDPLLRYLIKPLLDHMAETFSTCLPNLNCFRVLYQFVHVFGMNTVHEWMPVNLNLVGSVYKYLICENSESNHNEDAWKVRQGLYVWALNLSKVPFRLFSIFERFKVPTNDIFSFLLKRISHVYADGSKEQKYASELLARLAICSLMDGNREKYHELVFEWLFKDKEEIPLCSLLVLHYLLRNSDSMPGFVTNEIVGKLFGKMEHDSYLCLRYKFKTITKIFCYKDANLGIEMLKGFLIMLMENLSHNDVRVRWSAIKCIVKLLSSPLNVVDGENLPGMVLLCIEETLALANRNPLVSDVHKLHSCIMLASELVRFGKMHDSRLFTMILDFCFFEKQCGHMLLGAPVREASCYFAWCLSRSIKNDDDDFSDFFVTTFLSVALTDRSLCCRRAAAAVLQEWIGRKGVSNVAWQKILELVHFYSVSSLEHCMTELLFKQDQHHQEHIVSNIILKISCNSWDEQVRLLSAKCIGIYLSIATDHQHTIYPLLDFLLEKNVTLFHIIHGRLVALGVIIQGCKEDLKEFYPRIIEYLIYLKGVGSSLPKVLLEGWLLFLFRVRTSPFLNYCYEVNPSAIHEWIDDILINQILDGDDWDMPQVRFNKTEYLYEESDLYPYQLACISAVALKNIIKRSFDPMKSGFSVIKPSHVYKYYYYNMDDSFIKNVRAFIDKQPDLHIKVELKRALMDISMLHILIIKGPNDPFCASEIMNFLIDCLHDSTISKRHGDIGSHCRYTAMLSLAAIYKHVPNISDFEYNKFSWLCALLKISTDRMDVLRCIALVQLKTVHFFTTCDKSKSSWLTESFLSISMENFYRDITPFVVSRYKITTFGEQDVECLSWFLLGWINSVYSRYEGNYQHAEDCIAALVSSLVDDIDPMKRCVIGWGILHPVFEYHIKHITKKHPNYFNRVYAFLFVWKLFVDCNIVSSNCTNHVKMMEFLLSNVNNLRNSKDYWGLVIYYRLPLLEDMYSYLDLSIKRYISDQHHILNQISDNPST